jgi:hypothetical protein
MLSSQEEQIERARTLENDRKVREQGGTFLSHTHSDLGGRYALVSPQTIVGADPIPNYPAAAAHQHDPVPQEPPLGYRIDNPSDPVEAPSFTQQATGPTSPPSPLGQRVVGPSFNDQGDPAAHEETFPASGPARSRAVVGSSPTFRRKV